IMLKVNILQEPAEKIEKPYILIAGTSAEFDEAGRLLKKNGLDTKVLGRISVNNDKKNAIAHVNNFEEVANELNAREIIFCAGTFSYAGIIEQ
ncbi:MAG: hypothetical protein ABR503_13825, partial [Chitinophagaceae bacterium]